ncbi:alpha/beta fold hydrolase [Kitasatospora sp. NPDC093558]|uniref:alpha/beta hydrolase n=1 Tax=Kitasatospora sp. NPDC093558 TaxID=3155201 RepID=UPI003427D4C3
MPSIPPQDHAVPHVSTIPANRNEHVDLFVREYDGTRPHHDPEAVLMLHGRSVPAVAGFDLQHGKYSWAQNLAEAGYDVFVMELQGSGLSPRPEMDNPCNANPAQQLDDLVPNPLAGPCPAAYPKQLGNSQSEWDELNTVVEFIRTSRNVPQVAFIGWSAAAFVMGPYVIQHPGKVSSLLLLAPIFPAKGNASKPGTRFDPPHALPLTTPAAQFGFPMNLLAKDGLSKVWDPEVQCPDQRESGIVDVVWAAILDNDPLGKTWGPVHAGVPDGIGRFRNSFWWGWNDTTVPLDNTLGTTVPVLIVYGEFDTQAMHKSSDVRFNFWVPDLYAAIPGTDKLMIRVACAGHQMVWETRAKDLHTMSREWLKNRTVDGLKSGSYALDTNGNFTPVV